MTSQMYVTISFMIFLFFMSLSFLLLYIMKLKKRLMSAHRELDRLQNKLAASRKKQMDPSKQITEKLKAKVEKLSYLVYYDTITGLPNKLHLQQDMEKKYFKTHNHRISLLLIVLDNFQFINDTMGDSFGGELIRQAGKRIVSLIKEGCSVYRYSNDEFLIVLEDIKETLDVEIFVSHILAGFKQAFHVIDSVIHIDLSIGIALFPDHGKTMTDLLKNADMALNMAQKTEKPGYVLFHPQISEAFTRRRNIENCLRTALAKNEFTLYYQPQLDIKNNIITGFEALLRWNSPELGFVSPNDFIEIAEDTRLILPLGSWVLKTACTFLKKLHHLNFSNLCISVNVSALQLLQTDFYDMVRDILELLEIQPQFLELEITESIFIESFESINTKLEKLREMGVRIAMDDFGTGYSSLSYLKQLPITTLKIDKSFIDDISSEDDTRNLTRHIVKMGNSLGLSIVVEGVERTAQLEYLKKIGCHKIQGYLFSKPKKENDILRLLKTTQHGTKQF